MPSSPGTGSLSSGSGGGGGGSSGLGSPAAAAVGGKGRSLGAVRGGGERRELAAAAAANAADPDLDGVLNSALVLGLGERVADIQKRNARLVQEVDRIGRAASDKRQVRGRAPFFACARALFFSCEKGKVCLFCLVMPLPSSLHSL